MQNRENSLLDYRKIELEARARAKQTKSEYAARVSQASWLKFRKTWDITQKAHVYWR